MRPMDVRLRSDRVGGGSPIEPTRTPFFFFFGRTASNAGPVDWLRGSDREDAVQEETLGGSQDTPNVTFSSITTQEP